MKKRSTKHGSKFFGKIKTEHTIIEGIHSLLKELVSCDEIKSIIPGRIMKRGSVKDARIQLTIPTQTGWKALGKCKGTTQELFIVTDHPEIIEKRVKIINKMEL